ncbi:hypothetical protein JRQ81_006826 [Phrynocephalus forsythii]|uniref:Activating signal cointegrator 1 n=1 Tax=Phrynocephalus forsythii TaxID=171643 RepID=A0A9Q0XEM0_9SAUR|nr:hypothetical protein JRQ81_006826 [Phrynocephalus forsythii]
MAADRELVSWCVEQLRGGFGLEVGEEIIQYILSIEHEEEFREYVTDLIQGTDGKKKYFIDELIARWQKVYQPTSDPLPLHLKKDDVLEVSHLGDQTKRGRRKGRNKVEAPVYVEAEQPAKQVKTPLDLAKNADVPFSRLDETVEAIASGTLIKPNQSPEAKREELGVLVNPKLPQAPPVWVDQTGLLPWRKPVLPAETEKEVNSERSRLRIQDREIQEISDEGWCLSMHQPWASLLVKGIKRVEGRTWYTSHRGRLWIAATAKSPSSQEIAELEATYRILLQKGLEFPPSYPSGCLLGCVDLMDCLSQEQFQEQYPQMSQESSSPFVFICSNPQEMVVKFPIKGKHKIWKLDSRVHQGAKKGLMRQKAARV